MRRTVARVGAVALTAVAASCSALGGGQPAAPAASGRPADATLAIDVAEPLGEISPLVRGVSGSLDGLGDAGITFASWGGERATRYNYQLGNAWNLGRDGAYRNEGVRSTDDLAGDWLAANDAAGVASRLAVPGLGWVARDDRPSTCSFPDGEGGCLSAASYDCESTGPIADPLRANVGSSPRTVREWIAGYVDARVPIEYLAVDDSPERWGIEHYDVHPTCADYGEIIGTYLAYAAVLREVAPDAALAGPAMCCWFEHLDHPGPGDGSEQDLLSWFLERVDERAGDGEPLLDVVDVQFRPVADVVSSRDDDGIAQERVEATRELADPDHRVGGATEPVEFLPRLRRTIDEVFPGMPLMISDWRFGGEGSMSGAYAVAIGLGTFGREGVHAAAYAPGVIEPGSPVHTAFRLLGNADGRGAAFEGSALGTELDRELGVETFAALDRGTLRVLVVNPTDRAVRLELDVGAAAVTGSATRWSLTAGSPSELVEDRPSLGRRPVLEAPASSVSVVATSLRLDEPAVTTEGDAS